MGVAAYWRGSKAISDGIARDAYRDGVSWYDPDRLPPKPTPRPADWGQKTATRAADLVRRRLATARRIAEIRDEAFVWTDADTGAAIEQMSDHYRISKAALRAAFTIEVK